MSYTDITPEIKQAITDTLIDELDAKPILIIHMSNVPADDYLYLYIAEQSNGYIAGLANTSGKEVGLYENHYRCMLREAMEITASKIKYYL
jgi:hypothetical protein